MVLTIGGTDYEVRFGVRFVKTLDEKYNKKIDGMAYGMGLEMRIPFLFSEDITVLSEFLYEGTCHLKKRPTVSQVDDYIDECEDIEALFEEVKSDLKKQNATQKKTLAIEAAMKKQN